MERGRGSGFPSMCILGRMHACPLLARTVPIPMAINRFFRVRPMPAGDSQFWHHTAFLWQYLCAEQGFFKRRTLTHSGDVSIASVVLPRRRQLGDGPLRPMPHEVMHRPPVRVKVSPCMTRRRSTTSSSERTSLGWSAVGCSLVWVCQHTCAIVYPAEQIATPGTDLFCFTF